MKLLPVFRALLTRTKLDPATIDDVIVGTGIPEGPQGMNIGRVVAVRAELPISVPGVTVSRFCASGLASIAMGAAQIASGDMDIVVAGGTESITMLQNDMNMKNLVNPWVGANKEGIYHPMGMTDKVREDVRVDEEPGHLQFDIGVRQFFDRRKFVVDRFAGLQ